MVMQNIWQDFLKIVREEVGSRVVETWFKAVLLERWDALRKEVHLQAPNTFVRNWIQQRVYLSSVYMVMELVKVFIRKK